MTGILLPVASGFLLLSAVITAASTSVFSLSASRVRTLVDEGFQGADKLRDTWESERAIRSAVNFACSALDFATVGCLVAASGLFGGPTALILSVPVVALGVLVASEVIPRLIGSHQSVRFALFSAPFLLHISSALRPILAPFALLDDLLLRGNGEEEDLPGERELREIAELGMKEGVVEEGEQELVERAFRMDELTAWDIMVPRVDILSWRDSLTLVEVVPQLRTVPFSRIPVYGTSVDDITGVIHVREAYEAFVAGRGRMRLSELSRDPLFVPGSLTLPQLLRNFQSRRLHMGIVADEFGGTDGLVTLEDVIEELVGEIEDERDIAEESIHRISRNEVEVDGGVELREVNHAFNVSLPQLEYRSLNGFILEEMGRVPGTGEKMELPGLEIEVLESSDTQVLRARLRRLHTTPSDEG
jgi:putative hemolysin